MSKNPRAVRTPGATSQAPTNTDGSEAPTSAAAPEALPVATTPALDDLPNAIDIDAKTIRGPVLTKQGWVCPDDTGRVPADAKKL